MCLQDKEYPRKKSVFLGYSTLCEAKSLICLQVLITAWTTAVSTWDLQAGRKGAQETFLFSSSIFFLTLSSQFPIPSSLEENKSPVTFSSETFGNRLKMLHIDLGPFCGKGDGFGL